MKAGITTFGRLAVGAQFKVIWGTDERPLLHPNTLFTKCAPVLADGGSCNATAMVADQKIGVWIDTARAVLAFEPDRTIELAAGIAAAA